MLTLPYTRWPSLDRSSRSVNKKKAAATRGLLTQFKSFEIRFSLHVFDDLLSVTLHATQLEIGACRVCQLIDSVLCQHDNGYI